MPGNFGELEKQHGHMRADLSKPRCLGRLGEMWKGREDSPCCECLVEGGQSSLFVLSVASWKLQNSLRVCALGKLIVPLCSLGDKVSLTPLLNSHWNSSLQTSSGFFQGTSRRKERTALPPLWPHLWLSFSRTIVLHIFYPQNEF